jgi:hypothetical protein
VTSKEALIFSKELITGKIWYLAVFSLPLVLAHLPIPYPILFPKKFNHSFPEAPEVRAAYATFLAAKGDQIAAQRKFLEIPDIQRKKFIQDDYLKKVISWPPVAIDSITKIASAVGDDKRF